MVKIIDTVRAHPVLFGTMVFLGVVMGMVLFYESETHYLEGKQEEVYRKQAFTAMDCGVLVNLDIPRLEGQKELCKINGFIHVILENTGELPIAGARVESEDQSYQKRHLFDTPIGTSSVMDFLINYTGANGVVYIAPIVNVSGRAIECPRRTGVVAKVVEC